MTSSSPENSDDSTALTIDERFDLLSSRYRRYTLYSLSLFTPPVALARVVDSVTEIEFGVSADKILEERHKVYKQLYHNCIPRLVDANVIAYNQNDDTLELGPNFSQLESALKRTMQEEFPEQNEKLFVDS